MQIIAHRINKASELEKVPNEYGVEIDLRDYGNRLVLEHDPFTDGEDFEEWLKKYLPRKTLILNIKSERIEYRIKEILDQYKIQDYFFLDSSFPMIYQLSSKGERKIAIRYSEFEGLDTVLAMKDRVEWVWIDCFSRQILNQENYEKIRSAGLKLCLVSPELQGRAEDIILYRDYLKKENIILNAVCTKIYNADLWLSAG